MVFLMPVLLLSVLSKVAQVIDLNICQQIVPDLCTKPCTGSHFTMSYSNLIFSSIPLFSPFGFPVSYHIYTCSRCFTHTEIFHLCSCFRTLALTLPFVSEVLPSNTYRASSSLPSNSSSVIFLNGPILITLSNSYLSFWITIIISYFSIFYIPGDILSYQTINLFIMYILVA